MRGVWTLFASEDLFDRLSPHLSDVPPALTAAAVHHVLAMTLDAQEAYKAWLCAMFARCKYILPCQEEVRQLTDNEGWPCHRRVRCTQPPHHRGQAPGRKNASSTSVDACPAGRLARIGC